MTVGCIYQPVGECLLQCFFVLKKIVFLCIILFEKGAAVISISFNFDLFLFLTGDSNRDTTMDDLKSMNYLECCIKVMLICTYFY